MYGNRLDKLKGHGRIQLLTQSTNRARRGRAEGFGILSSDASGLQAAPPASCSSRCSGLCFASVAFVMKKR
jgi:hypothetical protein